MGAPVTPERILTSARGTALALTDLAHPPRLSMVFGGDGLRRELEDVGRATVRCPAAALDEEPDAVVVGVDFELSLERLSAAADAVRRGAFFAATNRDPIFPLPGRLMAGAGAVVAAVVTATGREPDLVIGKPEPGLMLEAAAVAGIPVTEAVVIGDGLLTDIRAAHAVGARSVLVLTGVSTEAMARALPLEEQPTVICDGPADLGAILDAMAAA
jgi:HAD superfamily hydrolase (TIGR01450 family)